MGETLRLLFVVNVDWFFLSHRLPIALAAMQKGFEVHVATSCTEKADEITSHGFHLHRLPSDRGQMGVMSLWRSLREIYKVLRLVQPDIVHMVTIKPVLLGGITARLLNIPGVVIAISGLGAVFTAKGMLAQVRRFLVKQIYRLALRQSNKIVIFQNPDDKRLISDLVTLRDEDCEIIPGSGVDLSLFQERALSDTRPIVMLAARLLKDKGVLEFLAAVHHLQENPAVQALKPRFVLVGDIDPFNPASMTDDELQEVEQEGLVELWGQRTDMPDVLSQAHIVVLPSYREGFPKVLIEAAAVGRAVVTTDVPGCRDAIEAGTTGVLVPVRDAVSLANAIETLLLDPDLTQTMGQAGRGLAERKFDVKHVVDRHLKIYQRLLRR